MPAMPVQTLSPISLEAEWERIETLGQCLAAARQNQPVGDALLKRLELLNHQVSRLRGGAGPWQRLPIDELSGLEMDVLACVLAIEAAPRLGWLFHALQPGIAQPYPTPALIQALFALQGEETAALRHALSAEGSLRRRRLIQAKNTEPFEPIKPAPGVTDKLQGWPGCDDAPPGAYRVDLKVGWDDLVLAQGRARMLREYLLWIRHRETVVDRWGGGITGGPLALFAGPSGTGKTFAAAILANELGWPLYRVDLGRLVSKYIGQTEKNLNRLFDAAHERPLILQFDEADSLMSKRGEVKEARDRYANMEVSHLLARVESHRGPCILTTNLREHLDKAFSRRFQMVVEFPRPDAEARALLWRRLLPPRAPVAREVDPDFLARSVNLTGGSIRNAALHAAYLAADEDRAIGLEHVAIAVWRELAKDGQQAALGDLGPLARHLPPWVSADLESRRG